MIPPSNLTFQDNLDPADWVAYRDTAAGFLQHLLEWVQHAPARPVWQEIPPSLKSQITDEVLPIDGEEISSICREFIDRILPYGPGNLHPRFFGWVNGAGTPTGILSEMASATLNANLGGRDHSAVYIERCVLNWCKEIFGFSSASSGILTSGTSMATLCALAIARTTAVGDIRRSGLQRHARQLVAYTSAEAHISVTKAIELLGIGRDNLRLIPTDASFQMDLSALERAIKKDLAENRQPFAVVGTIGTVNTGAIDDCVEISRICRKYDLWFHIDGAFGAWASLTEDHSSLRDGIACSDSIAADFHKWLHVPYDGGCLLVKDERVHYETFSTSQPYLARTGRGLGAGHPWFCDYGPELSRGFRGLKVWFLLKEKGIGRVSSSIAKNCAQAKFLEEMVQLSPSLELMAPTQLNIVCFRYNDYDSDDGELNKINSEIVTRLQESGLAAPSTTILHGKLAIRVSIVNHRTSIEDLESLISYVERIAAEPLRRIVA